MKAVERKHWMLSDVVHCCFTPLYAPLIIGDFILMKSVVCQLKNFKNYYVTSTSKYPTQDKDQYHAITSSLVIVNMRGYDIF